MKNVEMTIVDGVNTPWDKLDDWQKNSNQYTCTLIYDSQELETPFFTGSAWKDEPTWKDVLGSLISDAKSYESSRDFTDFCNEFGYDTDSIRAERIYQACKETSYALNNLFGEDLGEIEELLMEEGY